MGELIRFLLEDHGESLTKVDFAFFIEYMSRVLKVCASGDRFGKLMRSNQKLAEQCLEVLVTQSLLSLFQTF